MAMASSATAKVLSMVSSSLAHTDHVWKARERLDRRIPIHCVNFGEIAAPNRYRIKSDPALSFDNLNRESAGRKDQRKQRVRIQRNGLTNAPCMHLWVGRASETEPRPPVQLYSTDQVWIAPPAWHP